MCETGITLSAWSFDPSDERAVALDVASNEEFIRQSPDEQFHWCCAVASKLQADAA
jgi:hypothetical protein